MSHKDIVFSAMAVAASMFCSLPAAGACLENQSPAPKVVHDAVEYNAYMTALNNEDPSARAAALERFADDYPASVMCIDAMEQAMAAYQEAHNAIKLEKAAERLWQVDHDNLRALVVLVTMERSALDQGQGSKLRLYAERGLRALEKREKPTELSEAAPDRLKSQWSAIFHGGMAAAALREKDFTTARKHYTQALQFEPDNVPDTWQLGIADLEMPDPDVAGFWYVARAIYLIQENSQGAASMASYGKSKYIRYHGSEQGWAELVKRARTESALPRNFTVARVAVPVPTRPVQPPVNAAGQPSQQGIPASITSQGSDGTLHGVPASITSQDSKGLHGVPASVSSAGLSSKTTAPRGVPASVASATPAAAAPVQQEDSAATVFVFKDGHRVLSRSYVIFGKTLFNYSTNPMSKVSIDEIDLDATRKVNDDRGVVVRLE